MVFAHSLFRFPFTIAALTAFAAVGLPAPLGLAFGSLAALGGLALGTRALLRRRPVLPAALAPALGLAVALLWPGPSEPRRGGVDWSNARYCTAVIVSDPRYNASGWPEFDAEIRFLESAVAKSSASGRFRVAVRGLTLRDIPHVGALIRFRSRFRLGERRVDVLYRRVETLRPAGAWDEGRSRVRLWWRERLALLGGRSGPLAEALTLGASDNLTPLERRIFREAGASAVLALSGLHLALLAMALLFLLQRPLGKRVAEVIITLTLVGFVALTGPLPSLVRSLAFWISARVAERLRWKAPGLELTALSGWILLYVFPDWIDSASFLLSLGAMAGIFLLQPHLQAGWERWLGKWGSKEIALGCAATVGTGPIGLLLFGTLYPQGILANAVVALPVMVFLFGSFGFLVAGLLPGFSVVDTVFALLLRLLGEGVFLLLEPFRWLGATEGWLGWWVWGIGLTPLGVLVYKYLKHGYFLRFPRHHSALFAGTQPGISQTLGPEFSDQRKHEEKALECPGSARRRYRLGGGAGFGGNDQLDSGGRAPLESV